MVDSTNTGAKSETSWSARLLLWLLGGWLFLAILTAYMAGGNFAALKPDRLPRTQDFYGDIPEEKREMALRYAASELNRKYFQEFYTVQFVLANLALALCALSGRPRRIEAILLGVALAISAWLLFSLTPDIVELGREIDDVPRDPLTPDREEFNGLHRQAVILDSTKILVILAAAGPLLRGRGAS